MQSMKVDNKPVGLAYWVDLKILLYHINLKSIFVQLSVYLDTRDYFMLL